MLSLTAMIGITVFTFKRTFTELATVYAWGATLFPAVAFAGSMLLRTIADAESEMRKDANMQLLRLSFLRGRTVMAMKVSFLAALVLVMHSAVTEGNIKKDNIASMTEAIAAGNIAVIVGACASELFFCAIVFSVFTLLDVYQMVERERYDRRTDYRKP